MSSSRLTHKKNKLENELLGLKMPDLTIVYWRDIPAQLIIGTGRKAIKQKLSDKYEKAIDRCAMKVGAKDSEAYLQDWRKKNIPLLSHGDDAIKKEALKIEQEYSDRKLMSLIKNNGWNEVV